MKNFRRSGQSGQTKIAVLALSYFFVFGLSNVSYFLSVYYARAGAITAREAGLVVSVFYIVSVFSRPFLAYVLSRLGFRKLFSLATLLFVAGSVAMALFGLSFWPAFLSRAVLGLASSLYKIGFSTYQALAFGPSERGRAYALIMVGELMPLVLAAPLAETLIGMDLPRLYIWTPVLMSIAAGVAASRIPPLPAEVSAAGGHPAFRNPFRGMGECLRTRAFALALLSTFFFSMADAGASFMSSMTASYGLMASYFLSFNALVGIAVRLLFSRGLDRFAKGPLAALCAVCTSGAVLMASVDPSESSLTLLGVLFGVGMGFGFPLHLALAADSAPPHRQAQASAMTWFAIGLNFSLVPLFMGWFEAMTGPVATFRAVAAAALAGAALLFALQTLETFRSGKKTRRTYAP